MNTVPNENICGLKREDFQTTVNGKKTDLYILRNALGNEVAITNYGGAVVAIMRMLFKDMITLMMLSTLLNHT